MIRLDGYGRLGARLAGRAGRPEVVAQALLLLALCAAGWQLFVAISGSVAQLGVKSGFGFLFEAAPFELGESVIPFRSGDIYLRAFAAGLANTLKVAVLGILLSTVVGLAVALGQLSPSVVIARICRGYVEVVRNVPLLLQLIFWHTFLTRSLPTVRQALSPAEGVYLTNRGLYLPAPVADPAHAAVGWAALAGMALATVTFTVLRRRDRRGFPARGAGLATAAALLLPPIATFLWMGAPLALDRPALAGFNFAGGVALLPEFAAMLIGLTLYVGAFNAEIIRSGIQGVTRGQREAGLALGLSPWQVMRKIILPQALRIILPALTNSYLNLTKESSLAVAIGYPDLVRVSNIALAETGQSIECIAIIMIIYLVLSLITSLILNRLNARSQLVER